MDLGVHYSQRGGGNVTDLWVLEMLWGAALNMLKGPGFACQSPPWVVTLADLHSGS